VKMNAKILVSVVVFGILCMLAAAWFRPVYRANLLLQQVATFKSGITEAKKIEELERKGLVRKLNTGCIDGFEDPSETPAATVARSKNQEWCYGFMFRNTLPATLHLAPHTGVYGTLTVRHGYLSVVRMELRQNSLSYSLSDLDCDSCTPDRSNYWLSRQVNGLERTPGNAHVELTRNSNDQQRRDAYAIDVSVLRKIGEAKDGRDLNPSIWRQGYSQ